VHRAALELQLAVPIAPRLRARKGWTVADAHVYADDGIRLEGQAFDYVERLGYRFTGQGSYTETPARGSVQRLW
jgi:hypothetical protein